ncbi:hypothetical protein T459_16059 [Capsicum annuum]|uniref:TF-B3 domain-containing protein n=1 Tax=Capsicum annuum TaxID=4072 RepID=A0A2G2Z7M9_CAPAN|nr:putative B3 domain-containing protein REM17-like [Capsicum annuum]PHT78007.1 hypothetical protein T459_16059 [Capsicum annuum]
MHHFSPKGKKSKSDSKRVPAPRKEAYLPALPFANANRQFVSTINPYSLCNPYLYLQLAFAKSNGLVNKRCKMILRDLKQRSWPMLLVPMGHHVAISRGWRQLREANNVQIGDPYKVELVKNGIIPIAVFHCEYMFT